MGDHGKLIAKMITVEGKEIILKHGDLLIRCIPEKEGIFFPEFSGETPACLVKIFAIEDLDGTDMTAWQIGEGISLLNIAKTWGYDEVKTFKEKLEKIYRGPAQKAIITNKVTYAVIKKEELSKK